MNVVSTRKGQTVKTLVIESVETTDESRILDHALAHAGESRDSLFGWDVTPVEDDCHRWTVNLYTA